MRIHSNSLKLSPPNLVFPFFILSGVSYFVATVLLCIAYKNFYLHYAQPKLIAITHVLVLGFITSIIFGSLFKMFPILFEIEFKKVFLGKISFYCLLIGLILLIPNLWTFNIGIWLHVGSCFTLLSFILFSYAFLNSFLKSTKWFIEYDFIVASNIWLLLTGLIGVLLIFNFTNIFMPITHIDVLKIHSHMGILGWILQLIIGISSRLLPMFLITKNINTKKLNYSFYLINGGLVLFSTSVYLSLNISWMYVAIGIIEFGICIFLYHIFSIFSKRVRRNLDTSLIMTYSSFVVLLILLPIAILLPSSILKESTMMTFRIVYGIMILVGFSGSLILGQALKLVPFIVWMYKFQKLAGCQKTPLPKDLISETISRYVQYLLWCGLVGLILSIICNTPIGILLSAGILVVSAILFNINIAKALLYKSPINYE